MIRCWTSWQDMLHLEDSALYISSSHVGSMGGIMAIRRGEAHMAGCHLLDTADGSYNKAFIRKYFPQKRCEAGFLCGVSRD